MARMDSLPVERHILRQNAKDRVKQQVVSAATEHGILLVKTDDLPSEGLLSVRQQQWINSPPYDARTQNPVLYKLELDQTKTPKLEIERDEARQEVQSLPEIVTRPSDVESGGVEARLREGRKNRHDSTILSMKDELALISSECEVQIQSAIDHLKSQLAENKQVVADLFRQVSTKEDLGSKTLAELKGLWEQLSSETTVRQSYIQTLDTRLSDIETERAGTLTKVLHDYAHQISTIAYLLPNDVERLFEEEAHLINTALLENRKIYSQLCTHLHTRELSEEREYRDRWESIVTDWKELISQSTLTHFQSFLSSEIVTESPKLERVREQLAAEQRNVQRRREALLTQVGNLAPLEATQASVNELKESADKLHQQLESVHTSFLLSYQSTLESLSRECESEMERCKDYLVSSGAVDSTSIHTMLNNLFVPQLEKVAIKLREELQDIERNLDITLTSQKAQFENLFNYCLGAALLWDQHLTSVTASQTAFQERLDSCRLSHDRENQNLEVNLDLLLDRLRQGPTQEALKEYLQESLRVLGTIKEGYERFHTLVLEEARGYPQLVQNELDLYDAAICQYLGVSRMPKKKSKSKVSLTKAPSERQVLSPRQGSRLSRMDSRASRQESRNKSRKGKALRSKTTPSNLTLTQPEPSLATINSTNSLLEDAITTSGGVKFYLQSKPSNKEDGTFLTQDEESEGSAVSFATENVALTQEVFTKTQERMVLAFLEQLEQWRASSLEKAQTTLSGKEEECHTELDLRLHLHEPRPSRVEKDIHNVRLAELIAHRERVIRHSTGLTTSLRLQRGAGERLKELLAECGEKCAKQVEGLVTELDTCSNTIDLLKVQSRARESHQQHIEELTQVSVEQKRLSASLLSQLTESNTAYRTSIRLFSEGGNYCPEEVELFAKKLDKLSGKINSTQSHINAEMKSVTERQVAASHDRFDQFENVFKVHHADLAFLEAISRTLTSAQVKVKSEVMESNNQSTVISKHISQLKTLVEQAQAKSTPSSEILSRLSPLFELIKERVNYLYCRALNFQGSRVGGHSSITVSGSGMRPIGSMNVTKSIMEHVSKHSSMGSSSDRKLLAVTPVLSGTKTPMSENQLSVPPLLKPVKQSRKKITAVIDRQNINFGVGGGEDDSSSFLPRIRAILRATHSDLYSLTESYYKSRGSHQSTRPDDIHESFEQHIDSLITKSQSYRSQAEEYRNNCVQELRDQLASLMTLLEKVPRLVFADLLQEWRASGRKARETSMVEYTSHKEASAQEKMNHQNSLRPSLGHPSHSSTLDTLCAKEEIRYQQLLVKIKEHAEKMTTGEQIRGLEFANGLSELTKKLLTVFDAVTSENEIIPTDDNSKEKYSMEELLRNHVQGTLTPDPSVNSQTSQTSQMSQLSQQSSLLPGASSRKVVWPSLPPSELVKNKQEKLVSKKCTSAHEAVIQERDAVLKECCEQAEALMAEIKLRENQEKLHEEKWFENWIQSVDKVKQLYLD